MSVPIDKNILVQLSYFCLFIFPNLAVASSNLTSTLSAMGAFPLIPRLSPWGLTGTNTLVGGDIMLPIYGYNGDTILFLDGQGKTAFDTDWFTSLGTGIRTIYDEKRILGSYVFVDRSISTQNQEFWFVSPGIESMGQQWDFRANGYIPVSSKKVLTGTNFANTFGNFEHTQFSGHNQFDVIVDNYEEVGWTVDGEIGRRIPGIPAMRAYVGGYYVDNSNTDSINGVSGRLEYAVNSFITLSAHDTYDNEQHNTFEVGVRLTLGGVNKSPRNPLQPIRERWLDPIERNLSTLGQGSGTVISNQQTVLNNEEVVLQRENIWFFDTNASSTFAGVESCTAENPCSAPTFNQTVINEINNIDSDLVIPPGPTPWFYFRSGNYSAIDNGMPLVLQADSLFSRTQNWQAPQRGAIFSGGFVVNGNSVFDAITLLNDPVFTQPYAILLNTGGTLTLDNTLIGINNNLYGQAYAVGVQMNDANLDVLDHSEIITFSNNATASIGIHAVDNIGSNIHVSDSQITAIVNGVYFNVNYVSAGILAENEIGASNTTANIIVDNMASVTSSAIGNFGQFTLTGVLARETANNLTIETGGNVAAEAKVNYANAINAQGVSLIGNTNNVQLDNGTITTDIKIPIGDPNFSTINATGLVLTGITNTVNLKTSSKINVTAIAGNAQAIVADGIAIKGQSAANNNITVDNSQINVQSNVTNLIAAGQFYSVASRGIFIDTTDLNTGSTNTVTIQNNSQINAGANVTNANLSTGYDNSILAEGINIGAGTIFNPVNNITNMINISNNSSITADAQLTNGAFYNPNTVAANGINILVGDNSTNQVNLTNSSQIKVNSTLVNGGDYYNNVTANGVKLQAGDNSSNLLTVNNSDVIATGLLTNGGNFINTVLVNGVNSSVGNGGDNTITIGDNSSVQSTATLQQTGSDAINSVTAYGIHAYGNAGGSVENTILMEGTSTVNATADIMNGGTGQGSNAAVAEGILVDGSDNVTTLKDAATINAAANSNGTISTAVATGIESIAPMGPTNVVDNQVDPINNTNITALQNGVNDGQKIDQHP